MTQWIRQGVCCSLECLCVLKWGHCLLWSVHAKGLYLNRCWHVGLWWWMSSLLQIIHPQQERAESRAGRAPSVCTFLIWGGVCILGVVRVCLFWSESVCFGVCIVCVSLFCRWWALGIDILNHTEGFFDASIDFCVSIFKRESMFGLHIVKVTESFLIQQTVF